MVALFSEPAHDQPTLQILDTGGDGGQETAHLQREAEEELQRQKNKPMPAEKNPIISETRFELMFSSRSNP